MARNPGRSERPGRAARRRAIAATGVLASVVAAAAPGAGAYTPPKTYACYSDSTDELFHLNYPTVKTCPSGETLISWNLTGPQGATGAKGAQGAQGSQGAHGAAGLQGPPGAQGAAGARGPQGAAGAKGAQGGPGAQGAQGARGPQGAKGTNGPQGPQGARGPTGATGLVKGSVGPQGVQGPHGAQGAQGAQGSQGVAGTQGSQGATGSQGPAGTRGAPGPVGAQGGSGSAPAFAHSTSVATSIPGRATVVASLKPTAAGLYQVKGTATLDVPKLGVSCWLANQSHQTIAGASFSPGSRTTELTALGILSFNGTTPIKEACVGQSGTVAKAAAIEAWRVAAQPAASHPPAHRFTKPFRGRTRAKRGRR